MSSHLQDEKKGDAYTQGVGPADTYVLPDYQEEDVEVRGGLKRQLKNRHIAMISIGGVIGTGLFLGTGGALANGGPLGLVSDGCGHGFILKHAYVISFWVTPLWVLSVTV
jgi:amino acid transporter